MPAWDRREGGSSQVDACPLPGSRQELEGLTQGFTFLSETDTRSSAEGGDSPGRFRGGHEGTGRGPRQPRRPLSLAQWPWVRTHWILKQRRQLALCGHFTGRVSDPSLRSLRPTRRASTATAASPRHLAHPASRLPSTAACPVLSPPSWRLHCTIPSAYQCALVSRLQKPSESTVTAPVHTTSLLPLNKTRTTERPVRALRPGSTLHFSDIPVIQAHLPSYCGCLSVPISLNVSQNEQAPS